jgi:V-type H+-transporting ATPase subunit F
LAGVGDTDHRKGRGANYFVVSKKTPQHEIESALRTMLSRPDIAVVLICQTVANDVRHMIEAHKEAIPCILEIPSKDSPFDKTKDTVMVKLTRALGVSMDE